MQNKREEAETIPKMKGIFRTFPIDKREECEYNKSINHMDGFFGDW